MDVTIPTLSDVVRNPRRKSIDYGLNGQRLQIESGNLPRCLVGTGLNQPAKPFDPPVGKTDNSHKPMGHPIPDSSKFVRNAGWIFRSIYDCSRMLYR
jgi:hypothetical protein